VSAPAAPTVNAPTQPVTPSYPAGVGEIVKMLDANVDHDTIKAYIRNSFTYWNLTSQDIINFKERNVPSDIVGAMLQRDAELRDQAMQAAQGNPSSAPATYDTNTVVTPGYDSSSQYVGAYPYATDGYPYSDYPYSYPYPYNYGGWWGWPVWGGGGIFFDSFGPSHFNNDGHHHEGHSDFHHADPHGNSFHGNHGNMAGWHGNNGNAVTHSSGFTTHSAWSGATHNSTFSTRSSSPRMGGASRGFGAAGMGHPSTGHFGGGWMGGHSAGHTAMGGGGTHMGGGFGGGHGGGGSGHR